MGPESVPEVEPDSGEESHQIRDGISARTRSLSGAVIGEQAQPVGVEPCTVPTYARGRFRTPYASPLSATTGTLVQRHARFAYLIVIGGTGGSHAMCST
jgi:hypothetical protein